MKRGEKVNVYQRPSTKEDFEGVATLVFVATLVSPVDSHSHPKVWSVRFNRDEGTVVRKVWAEDRVTK